MKTASIIFAGFFMLLVMATGSSAIQLINGAEVQVQEFQMPEHDIAQARTHLDLWISDDSDIWTPVTTVQLSDSWTPLTHAYWIVIPNFGLVSMNSLTVTVTIDQDGNPQQSIVHKYKFPGGYTGGLGVPLELEEWGGGSSTGSGTVQLKGPGFTGSTTFDIIH